MFAGKTIWDIFFAGGITMFVLLACSLLSIAVIVERIVEYSKKSVIKRLVFMPLITQALENDDMSQAMKICGEDKSLQSPLAKVALAGLKKFSRPKAEISSAMEREISLQTALLERFTSIVGTIGNIAVYIGLFGTVLGIIQAFHDISSIGTAEMNTVIDGVAAALISTAAGLAVAIPSVVAYNYFMRRIDRFVSEMELGASELNDLAAARKTE